MESTQICASKRIKAPASRIYAIIADYQKDHPLILPKPPFETLTVEEGGFGAGTIIRFQMRVMGKLRTFRAKVSEPEPGQVLVETDLDTGTTTTFEVETQAENDCTLVTISTITQVRDGLAGRFEGWFTKRLLLPIYEKELEQLAVIALGENLEDNGA